jgi:hypothetical protein
MHLNQRLVLICVFVCAAVSAGCAGQQAGFGPQLHILVQAAPRSGNIRSMAPINIVQSKRFKDSPDRRSRLWTGGMVLVAGTLMLPAATSPYDGHRVRYESRYFNEY